MKEYLGDSVYAEYKDGMICLTTENDSSGPSNTIYLDDQVIKAFGRFLDHASTTVIEQAKARLKNAVQQELEEKQEQRKYTG